MVVANLPNRNSYMIRSYGSSPNLAFISFKRWDSNLTPFPKSNSSFCVKSEQDAGYFKSSSAQSFIFLLKKVSYYAIIVIIKSSNAVLYNGAL